MSRVYSFLTKTQVPTKPPSQGAGRGRQHTPAPGVTPKAQDDPEIRQALAAFGEQLTTLRGELEQERAARAPMKALEERLAQELQGSAQLRAELAAAQASGAGALALLEQARAAHAASNAQWEKRMGEASAAAAAGRTPVPEPKDPPAYKVLFGERDLNGRARELMITPVAPGPKAST